MLISLQTDGKGLPNGGEDYAEWSRRIFVEGETAERMQNVGGLWRKQCEEHKYKMEEFL